MNPHHIRAFQSFSGAHQDEFQCADYFGQLLVSWKGRTYQVTSFDDFVNTYRDYFTRLSYAEIYTQIPSHLWTIMLEENIELTPSELIANLYREWGIYWDGKREEIKGGKSRYNELKDESWRDLQALFFAINFNISNAVSCAGKICDAIQIPLIALVIKDSYEDEDEFYIDCVSVLVEYGEEWITDGETFERVSVKVNGMEEEYFIYNPMYDFEEATQK